MNIKHKQKIKSVLLQLIHTQVSKSELYLSVSAFSACGLTADTLLTLTKNFHLFNSVIRFS